MTIDGKIKIEYKTKNDEINVFSNLNKTGVESIIENFIMSQIGQGKDQSKREERDIYHIELDWSAEQDDIFVKSDTGNKGLREGILMATLSRVSNEKIEIKDLVS